MDQEKIGKYIASLRRQAGLTQESLGKKLGVTNKTISRWENGNYMPDVGMLPPLARELNVSINELLAGEKISDDAFQKKPDGTILEAATVSAFSFEERKAYFRTTKEQAVKKFSILGYNMEIKEIKDYSKYRYFDLVVGIFFTLLAIAFVSVAIFFFASKFN